MGARRVAEWFPTMTQRRSVATVQGTEWLGSGRFKEQERRHFWLLECVVFSSENCAMEWDRFGRANRLRILGNWGGGSRGRASLLPSAGR